MKIRSLFAVAGLLVTSAAFALGAVPRGAGAQDVTLTASVVEGSCDSPGINAGDLRDLTTAEGGVLTSFSRVDIAIADLTSAGYAVVVASDGSTVACGDVSGTGNDVYVAMVSTSDAGYGGIAWLHARDSQTQISLFISDQLGGGGGSVEPPTDETPQPPVDNTPEPAATKTPKPQKTPKATSTKEAGDTTAYESPTFHYTLEYDSTWAVKADETNPTDNGPQDFLQLFNGTSTALFYTNGAPEGMAVDNVAQIFQQRLESDTTVSNVVIRTDDNGNQILGGDSKSSFVAFNFKWTNSNNQQIDLYDYYQFFQLPGQPAVLIFLNEGQQISYDQQADARQKLSDSVKAP